MIIFDLACAHGHRFEGWFASGEEFERQQERKLVRCPVCDDATSTRLPSARVSVPRGPRATTRRRRGDRGTQPRSEAVVGLPAEVLAKLREIVRNTENVGRRFPEEARKIHYEEVPPRAIRGQASRDEAEALPDEGIEFAPLPPYPDARPALTALAGARRPPERAASRL